MGDPLTVPAWLDRSAGIAWRSLAVGAAILAVLWLLAQLALITLPLIVAVILTTLTVPPTRELERRGLRSSAATTVTVVGGLVAIVALLSLLAPRFVDQIAELGPTITSGREELVATLADGPLGLNEQRIEELLTQAREQLAGRGDQIVSGVLSGAALAVNIAAGAVLILVLLFFLTKDGEEIVGWMLARTPPEHRETARAVGRRAWSALGGYVRGTALIALINAVGVAIGLLIIGVPLVAPLALLVFLGAFLPVIGAFIAGLIAVLVAAADGGLTAALFTLGVIVVVQQVEGNLLQPLIMRRAVALHPVVVLSALTAGAAVAGIVGAFLAVPIAAVLAAVGNELRLRSEESAAATGSTA